jgi:hypothetical protein
MIGLNNLKRNKMKNIHVLPTNQKSKIFFNHNKGFEKYQFSKEPFVNGLTNTSNQHIYITNDEKPKAGDWVIKISSLYKGGGNIQKYSFIDTHFEDIVFKKIILTTDLELIADGIQAIDDEFLEWFVKNPSCEYAHIGFIAHNDIREYKIIIPQEEPKQETLEEAAERLVPEASCELNNSEASYWQQGWIAGVKWQVEQIPSIIEQYLETAFISKEQGYKNPKDWFEQFKNK